MSCSKCNVNLQTASRKFISTGGVSCDSINLCDVCAKSAERPTTSQAETSCDSVKICSGCDSIMKPKVPTSCESIDVCESCAAKSGRSLATNPSTIRAENSCDSANVCSGCSSLMKPGVPTSCNSIGVCESCTANSVRFLATNPSKIPAETSCDSAKICSGCASIMKPGVPTSCDSIDVCECCGTKYGQSFKKELLSTQAETSRESFDFCSRCASTNRTGAGTFSNLFEVCTKANRPSSKQSPRAAAGVSCDSVNVCSGCSSLMKPGVPTSCNSIGVCGNCATMAGQSRKLSTHQINPLSLPKDKTTFKLSGTFTLTPNATIIRPFSRKTSRPGSQCNVCGKGLEAGPGYSITGSFD